MGTPAPRQGDRDRAAGVTLAALAVSNLAANRILPDAAYVPWNLTVAAGLVALARGAGCRADELGFGPDDLARGLRVGGVAAGLVAAGNGVVWGSRHRDALFGDRRVTELDTSTAWFQGLVRIPLGTALVEEVAFRGVLPALLSAPRRPAWLPGLASSVLFGLWHVLPSLHLAGANEGAGRVAARAGPAGVPALAVGGTAAAGAVLHGLRRRGRHLAAPVMVHLAANLSGFVGARLLAGRR